MLAGIAANDSIVLVDYVNRLRTAGKPRREAILQAGRDRLRPILMTSATTILALLPLTVAIGEGARLRAPMAIAVIGGLVTSTILTLVVIPVVYELIDGLRMRNATEPQRTPRE
jgi:HAE1 family hydrophobic/amphiphilic exporter-1